MALNDIENATLAILKHLILDLLRGPGTIVRGPAGVHLVRTEEKDRCNHNFEKPLIALTIQGRKLIHACGQDLLLTPGSLLITCVDVPSMSTIIAASPEEPYLGLYLYLDRHILAEQALKLEGMQPNGNNCESVWTSAAGIDFLDLFRRLVTYSLDEIKAAALVPLIMRELHYLLLCEPRGSLLRHLYMNGGRDRRITDVIAWMRGNIGIAAAMEDLARMASMSVSCFHRHFKNVTGLSPLQYHKKLRLYEAQRLMLADNQHAAEAAFAVGYESITQFNREYRRMFGEPPGRHIAERRRMFGV